ncbi:MAG: YdcF family protein [Desulfobacteraceae bacterium]|nr:MAG: YdcF family protein [Desulfobacteraceae bacterium]
MAQKVRYLIYLLCFTAVCTVFATIFHRPILNRAGQFLVVDHSDVNTDAIIVLNTGLEYYPRLIEAASLFNRGIADTIIVNGNRKTDALRDLENLGFVPGCPWNDAHLRILKLLDVPQDRVVSVSLEDAYDTVTEAHGLLKVLQKQGLKKVTITTSKFHTRRALYIWQQMLGPEIQVYVTSAKADPFDPAGWWSEGRQIRWVLAEYGAWVYLAIKGIPDQ